MTASGVAPEDKAPVHNIATSSDLIVLEELSYLPFAQSGGQLLFRLISYERASVIVTANLAFGE